MRKLKMVPYLMNLPVIFMTGNRDVETEIKGLEAGARDFITKPIKQGIFKHRIELHLRHASYQAQLEDKVKALSDSVSLSFAELIECRDENTGGHVARTSKYVGMLGRKLIEMGVFENELTEADLGMIVRAAPLHDIGKIAISDRILLKPDRLNDEEFRIMKKHSSIGADMLKNMHARTPTQLYLQYARLIAESHHERYDGKGYPYSLKGDEIPLCGRIMAVADVYDALVGNRVYRKGIGHTEACCIILSERGTQFDPNVVDAFESICWRFSFEPPEKSEAPEARLKS
jgi:putative two-component system response regulator